MAETRKKVGKLSGLKISGEPNAAWKKFKQKLEIYDSIPISEWKFDNLFGYFVKRYQDQMKSNFPLSYVGPPSKCQEIYCTRRMMLSLGIEDFSLAKDYIDFVFDQFVIPKNITISSIGILLTESFIQKFKTKIRASKKITRSTQLPSDYETVINDLNLSVYTYGDLAFAKLAIDENPNNEDYIVYQQLFDQLELIGFDKYILEEMEA